MNSEGNALKFLWTLATAAMLAGGTGVLMMMKFYFSEQAEDQWELKVKALESEKSDDDRAATSALHQSVKGLEMQVAELKWRFDQYDRDRKVDFRVGSEDQRGAIVIPLPQPVATKEEEEREERLKGRVEVLYEKLKAGTATPGEQLIHAQLQAELSTMKKQQIERATASIQVVPPLDCTVCSRLCAPQ